ncbi:Biotin synthase [Cardamine amara subsp. amara]|uniref:Biotin synthase n=1 Tax=Cardamine amara subsp. amara TaxID=228776 RepID=A0ABD1BSM2_CARAN
MAGVEMKSTPVYHSPVLDLNFHSAPVHKHALLFIKTGSCIEGCLYSPQSARAFTEVKGKKLMSKDAVNDSAKRLCNMLFIWL